MQRRLLGRRHVLQPSARAKCSIFTWILRRTRVIFDAKIERFRRQTHAKRAVRTQNFFTGFASLAGCLPADRVRTSVWNQRLSPMSWREKRYVRLPQTSSVVKRSEHRQSPTS